MSLGSDIIYIFHFPPIVCSMAFYHVIQFKSMQSGRRAGGFVSQRHLVGLEKYLNSTLPVGQVTFKFCLPGHLPACPSFQAH